MKNKILIPTILASVILAAGITMAFTIDSKNNTYAYTPSDISKANSNIIPGDGSASIDTINPADIKDGISHTVIGTVLSVGDPIDWMGKHGDTYGAVPVTIKVDEDIKGVSSETLTFYLHGDYAYDNTFYLAPYEPQFEIDEKILIHLTPVSVFAFQDGEALYSPLGKYSKYKIGEDNKVYNINYPNGRSLDYAKNESK